MTDPRVDAYLATLPAAQRDQLEALRRRVASLAPQATETISYGMPAFKLGTTFLISYAGWKRHSSVYPMRDDVMARHADLLRGYATTKGSLHFSPEQPLPDAVLDDLVASRLADLEAGGR
ncbi:MAG TPA: DUF1801 domain-containing protein [Candidatus Limnocylindrales bacterium]|nr:DUF1801 domain-containing protein [Candidatus Limnocylindrales bacterium]